MVQLYIQSPFFQSKNAISTAQGSNINTHMSKTIRTTDGTITVGPTKFTQGTTLGTGMTVPAGTTAQRPTGPVAGTFRYNTEQAHFEGYNGLFWTTIAQGIDPTMPFVLPIYTVAELGAMDPPAGSMAYCSDASGGAVPVFYDGTVWRLFDRSVVS